MRSGRSELTRGRDPRLAGTFTLLAGLTLVGTPLATSPAAAQQPTHEHHHGAGDHAAHAAPGGAIQVSPHLRVTPPRPATAADSARASVIVDSLRRVIPKYRDVRAAVDDGYVRFTPERRQRTVHFTNRSHAARNDSGFDPGRPTSLLYRRAPGGSLVLAGAMYTASKNASIEELDARVPLGIAQWHLRNRKHGVIREACPPGEEREICAPYRETLVNRADHITRDCTKHWNGFFLLWSCP